MRKLLALILCLVMAMAAVVALVACEPTEEPEEGENTYNIVVWVGEGMKDLTAQQIAKFNQTNDLGVTFNATIEIQSESKAIGNMEGKDNNSWPDIFCFAQDTLARATKGEMLQELNTASVTAIEENSVPAAIEAAKIGGTIRAFPMTADNGYFMYYDKRVITDVTHLGNLEDLIADCESAGRNFSMNLAATGGGWYAASFFYATGCQSEWVTGNNGGFDSYTDTFNSANGLIALKGMRKLLTSGRHIDSDLASDFTAGTPSAVVVSGIWDYETAKTALGDNLGIAPLPSFTVDGQSYQLKSYLGHKFMGIKPQSDGYKSYYLQQLVIYLTGAECQQERFNLKGWGPSDKSLNSSSEALNALKTTAIVLQGQYPTDWWTYVVSMVGSARTSTSDAALQGLLETYAGKLPSLKNQ